MIRGYHARAILLPVGRKFFARFLASRRRFKSPTTFFYFVATNTKETFLFTFLIDFNFLLYVYNMWVVPLFLKLGVSVENELEPVHVRKQKAQRWLQVDGEMKIAKSRHSKIFSVRSGIEMSMMRRQTEVSIVPSSRIHKEIPTVRGRDFDCSQTTWHRLRENCDRCANLWTVLTNLSSSSV